MLAHALVAMGNEEYTNTAVESVSNIWYSKLS